MKPTLVLVPGLLCDRALWAAQIEALQDEYECHVPDLRADDSIERMARRVLEENAAEKFCLAGLSMGGYVALEVMRQASQRVERLALLDTRAQLDSPEETQRRLELIGLAESERGFEPITNRMLPLLVHPSRTRDEWLVQTIRDMAQRIGIAAYVRHQRAIMARSDTLALLPRIICSVLVLCGREDLITPLPLHQDMAQRIPGARIEIIEQCGHVSTLERPEEVNDALRRWLSRDA